MITLSHITKTYGRETVLSDVSARFERGAIHGLIGRNGSGKTVLLRLIAGLTAPDAGTIRVGGKRIGRDIEMPPAMGLIIETPGFLPNLSGRRNLKLLADIRGRIGWPEIEASMRRVGLDFQSRKWVSRYSLGMRQRLGIAQAIMEDPELLLLDEPLNGLDNAGVGDMRRLLRALRGEGKTILLASHSASDIACLCDTVCEVDAGRLYPCEVLRRETE